VGPVDAAELRRHIAELEWYHTLELAPGVVTPGWFDTRSVVDTIAFPPTLAGERCLDVGTFNGFWAFEMERRGATEVIAVDVLQPDRWDWPANSEQATIDELAKRQRTGLGFEIARDALGSSVKRLERSVYDLDPAVDGTFDFVYVGSLLLHLRDPVGALDRVRTVCRGRLLLVDAVDLGLSALHPRRAVAQLDGDGRPWWWKPNVASLVRMLGAAGFEVVHGPRRFFMPPGAAQTRPGLRALASRAGREQALRAWKGDPHAAVMARPAVSGA
jgi:tRNA (mo5U34)-methyltransferase